MNRKEGQVPKRRAPGTISAEPNTPGRVLARLKEKLSLALGIDNGVFRLLVDSWARAKPKDMDDKNPSSKKTNAIVLLSRMEITNGMLFRYFEIIGCEEVEYTIKVKLTDGTVAEATEKMKFTPDETLVVNTKQKGK